MRLNKCFKNQRRNIRECKGSTHTAKPAYLEPDRNNMQKSIEDRSRIGVFRGQWHVGKAARAYLVRISNTMQKPVEGLSFSMLPAL